MEGYNKKVKTVCFIFETPVDETRRKVFLLDTIKNAGYKLVICDISYVTNRVGYARNTQRLLNESYCELHRVKSRTEISEFIMQLKKPVIVITPIQWSPRTFFIFKLLETRGIKYGYLSLNEYNDMSIGLKTKNRVINFFLKKSFEQYIDAFFVRIPHWLILKKGASFVISNTKERAEMYKTRYTANEGTEILILHSNVYEEALGLKDVGRLIDEKYCVWLDTYTPYHTDGMKDGIHVDPDKYYSSLNVFFKRIEKAYAIKVIIAAHPKADYVLHKESYDGFKIISSNTCLLCRDAEFVMTCASMSTMYPILYKKPLLFLIEDALVDGGLQTHVDYAEFLSESLGSRVINIDHFSFEKREIDSILNIREDIYDRKIREWIKKDYAGVIGGDSCEEILCRFFDKFF